MPILALLLLMNLVNGLSDAAIGCPFKLNCTHNMKILELPTQPVPVKLILTDIDYRYQVIDLSDPRNCLPQLLLDHNFSSIFPFKPYLSGISASTNISFFNCSSVVQLRNHYQAVYFVQNMTSCPIYVGFAESESVVESDLVYCIKLFDRVSSFHPHWIRYNKLFLTWSGTNFDTGCLKCENKLKKKIAVIISSSAGENETSLLFFIIYLRFLKI